MDARTALIEQARRMGDTFETLMNEVILANDKAGTPLQQAEGLRYLTRLFLHGIFYSEMHDRAYPKLVPVSSLFHNYGFASPDTGYEWSIINGNYRYRLFGRRGTARVWEIESWSGDWGLDLAAIQRCGGARHIQTDPLASIAAGGDIEFGPNGEFEVILSVDPQPGRNWVRIAPGDGCVVIRDIFHDWDNETRSEWYLERIDASYPPPSVDFDHFAEALDAIPRLVTGLAHAFVKGIEVQHYSLPPNAMHIQPLHNGQEERGQDGQIAQRDVYFLQGRYECGPDEAVIIEVEDIGTVHWNYYLTTHRWEAFDFGFRQTSLNGAQAVLDPDGHFRAVIAHRDPGVPNWLDTGGRPSGLILARYLEPKREIHCPRLRVVPLERLRGELPKTTGTVTASERSEILRRRMHSVRRRRCEN